jgi:antibiotic biosynthesis monooxygenase (ABM) superfamily enzyme
VRIAKVTHGDAAVRLLSGLETWFALPAACTQVPRPRWKMALVIWSGIFPPVLLSSHTVAPLLGPWLRPALVVLAATGLIVAAMTCVVMPTLVRLLAGWVYPATREP